jgi:hypothetical protein
VSTVLRAECAGLWRRTLLIEADGTCDTAPGVLWLQGLTAYVDSRGFAGTLNQHGDVFEWERAVNVQPPGPWPDAGLMRWDGEVLVETGVHEEYVEHWVRAPASAGSTGALFLTGPGAGLLVRTGGLFGWADSTRVVIGEVGSPQWVALRFNGFGDQVEAGGVRWHIEKVEGNVNL